MNKQIRRYREYLKYKNRIERFVANGGYTHVSTLEVPNNNGKRTAGDYNRIDTPTVQDIMEDGGWNYYKHTSTPCSCESCSGLSYQRHEEKIKVRKEIEEAFEYIIEDKLSLI